ncbi:MAG: class I SAM-dependent RNA methyltransferase [Bdellovibrionales bacterium]|nr:class I SAM-dependent RNA methyltransferase [Bdellovibrionales bacterium]
MAGSKKNSLKTADENQPFFVGQELELEIESLTFNGGRGLARKEGFVFFLPGTAPQEKVLAKVTKVKKNFAEAMAIQVLSPSPNRRTPPCPVAQDCGGCCWQHIDYPAQLKQKYAIVCSAYKKLAPGVFIQQPHASPNEFRYRNRIQVHKADDRIGFLKSKSHQIVPIEDCLISEEELTSQFANIRKDQGLRGRIEIARKTDGSVTIVSGKRPAHLHLFSQVNTAQNQWLIDKVIDTLSGQNSFQNIYDLYCGAGNFTLPIARAFPHLNIVGVELSESSIKIAKQEKSHAQFFASDVAQFLRKNRFSSDAFVILDPPRIGCDPSVIDELSHWGPDHILYISCNPMTQVRDLANLMSKYSIKWVQPIDLFPQTDHVEVMTLLSRSDHVG